MNKFTKRYLPCFAGLAQVLIWLGLVWAVSVEYSEPIHAPIWPTVTGMLILQFLYGYLAQEKECK